MCGICGVVGLDGLLDPAVRTAIAPMAEAIRHRGPDGDGFLSDQFAALGHRRLAIIDRAGGAQPITNEDGTCWIVFNGEIYNHHPLRTLLIDRGHRFRTASDTETILHAYEEYGPDCLDRLEGMFAFAIYDQRRRELFAARDRFGEKPLFYASLGGVFHFASEVKALYPSPLWDGELDLDCLEGYLSLGYILAPQTIYRHVRKLMPGHFLRLRNGQIELNRYWDVPAFDSDRREEKEVLLELEGLLESAVRSRLESEVPLGAFLSGGIDSGLVVSFMKQDGDSSPVVTTSVGFGNTGGDELEAAGITAANFSTHHFPHVIEPNLEDVLDPIVAAFDEPFADVSAIPTYYVSKAARQHVTVALSGDGGDETFSGYDFRYVPHVLESRLRGWIPGTAGRALSRRLGALWPRSRHLPRALRLGSIMDNLSRDAADAYYSDLCFMKPADARRLLGSSRSGDPRNSPVYESVTAPYRRCPSPDALQRAQYADLNVYMPNDPLVKVDRMSMLHGLEVRCPLLDRRLVEFAFRLPADRKMPRLHGKHLLRRLAERRLPAGISSLPKRGFDAPVGSWIAGRYAQHFQAEVFDGRSAVSGLLDLKLLRGQFEAHRRGVADHAYILWAVWMLEHWAQMSRKKAMATATVSH